MTEAYYRKLPVLAITSNQSFSKIGHHIAQVIDRSTEPNDSKRKSVTLPIVKDDDDLWDCEVKVNTAILELKRHGGGPVHIDLPTTSSKPYDTKVLPVYRVIDRIARTGEFPPLSGKIAVFVGSHKTWTEEETIALDRFCASNNAVVFCDHTSGYHGKYRLLYALVASQEMLDQAAYQPDIMIHIGEVTGDYYTSMKMIGAEVWRVSEDGEIRDTFRKLRYVYEMPERSFFERYTSENIGDDSYYQSCSQCLDEVRAKIPEIPLSNVWLASRLAHRLPSGSTIHFGILNSLRSWNFFDIPATVTTASNVGGFGIDGNLSSLVGASLAKLDRLYFCVLGDLAFFYDMNVMGNRHVGRNLRLLIVNNGKGTEFKQYNHHGTYFEEAADEFIAAAGHFGNKSAYLVRHYAEDLGFEYLSASSKVEVEELLERFMTAEITDKSIVFEVFTVSLEESKALEIMQNIEKSGAARVKRLAKELLGHKGRSTIKRILKK
jgi:2-succinyl-5-enolpyruvyl-6-hydroxy-3-cyclohexene-1-carboxylate synthase